MSPHVCVLNVFCIVRPFIFHPPLPNMASRKHGTATKATTSGRTGKASPQRKAGLSLKKSIMKAGSSSRALSSRVSLSRASSASRPPGNLSNNLPSTGASATSSQRCASIVDEEDDTLSYIGHTLDPSSDMILTDDEDEYGDITMRPIDVDEVDGKQAEKDDEAVLGEFS
jgi:hypothetical protein